MGIDATAVRRPDTRATDRRACGDLGDSASDRSLGLEDVPAAGTFVLIFTSLVVEALPFVLMGALVSALIEVYVPQSVVRQDRRASTARPIAGCRPRWFCIPRM